MWGGYELDVLYAVTAVGLAFTGPGRFSVDAALGLDLAGVVWGAGALALGVAVGLFTLASRRFVRAPATPEVTPMRRAA